VCRVQWCTGHNVVRRVQCAMVCGVQYECMSAVHECMSTVHGCMSTVHGGINQGSAQGPIWLGLGLLSPSGSGVQRKSGSYLDSGSRAQRQIGLLLGLGLWGKNKIGLPLGLGLGLWSPRPVGLWFGLGLLVCSGFGFCGRVPPPLSRPSAWERVTSPTGRGQVELTG
jgi:hypothetical protein